MMKFWWVNQNRTWKQEIEGDYMWSPQLNSVNKNIISYDNMKLVKKGDIIFSYYKKKIGSIGVASGSAYESPKPSELGTAGDDWDKVGWKIDMNYKELSFPLSPLNFFDQLESVLPKKHSPLNYDGRGYQGYLFSISGDMASILFGNLIIDQLSDNNSLS